MEGKRLTVEMLMKVLKNYPSDMSVKVALYNQISDLKEHTVGVDIDTNIESVWLCGDRE